LALQGAEADSWHEVCGLTRDPKEIARLAEWFDDLYENAESELVTRDLVKFAEELWRSRRRDSADIKRLSGRSLKQLANARDGSIIRDNTWIWIYDDPDVSKESNSYNSQLLTTHGNLSKVPYEVPSDPRKYTYDKVIDCFHERGRGGTLRVDPIQYRLYPRWLSSRRRGPVKDFGRFRARGSGAPGRRANCSIAKQSAGFARWFAEKWRTGTAPGMAISES
jgi:hypothetical protein